MLYTPTYEYPESVYLFKIYFGREKDDLQDVNLEAYIGMDDDAALCHGGLAMKMGALQNLLLTLGATGHRLISRMVDEMEDVLGESPAIIDVVAETGGLISLDYLAFTFYRPQSEQDDGSYAADEEDAFWFVDGWEERE